MYSVVLRTSKYDTFITEWHSVALCAGILPDALFVGHECIIFIDGSFIVYSLADLYMTSDVYICEGIFGCQGLPKVVQNIAARMLRGESPSMKFEMTRLNRNLDDYVFKLEDGEEMVMSELFRGLMPKVLFVKPQRLYVDGYIYTVQEAYKYLSGLRQRIHNRVSRSSAFSKTVKHRYRRDNGLRDIQNFLK